MVANGAGSGVVANRLALLCLQVASPRPPQAFNRGVGFKNGFKSDAAITSLGRPGDEATYR